MLLYRVCRSKYKSDLSGNGAKIHGGRWNSPGIAAVYTSSHKSLAVLESLVHTPPAILRNDFMIITLEVQGRVPVTIFRLQDLPDNWSQYPAPPVLVKTGDRWLKNMKSLLLKVPSVIIPSEYNYVINPVHLQITKVKIIAEEKLALDARIRMEVK